MRVKLLPVLLASLALITASCSSGGSEPEPDAETAAAPTGEATDEGEATPADPEGSLTWYTTLPAEPAEAILNSFGDQHPGITVTLTQLAPGPLLETLLADAARGDVKADVVTFSNQSDMEAALEAGAIEEFVPENVDALLENARVAEPYGYAAYMSPYVWTFRTDIPEDIAERFREGDWAMFDDPEVMDYLRGKVASGDPVVAGAPFSGHIALLDAWGEDRYWPWLEGTFRELEPLLFDSNVPAADAIDSGEVVAGLITESFAVGRIADGMPAEIAMFDPNPNSATITSKVVGSTQPDNGTLYINWLLSDEGQEAIETHYNGLSAFSGREDARAYTEEDWFDPSQERFDKERLHLPSAEFIESLDREDFLNRWQSAMGR